METRFRGRAMVLFLAAALCLSLPAMATPSGAAPKGAAVSKVLANGMEVIVAENHSVPLVTICVAFRCGALSHTPETAGLFHLYEHMLFTANEKYGNQAAFKGALNKMGVSNWNGGTGNESVNYYVTVPSDKLGDGIEFWSWAVKKPVFDKDTLENEKSVVTNEIQGYHSDPDSIFSNAISSRAFATYPWRKNIDGPEANIAKATVEQLEAIRAQYYVPNNTALLIGGDVTPAKAFELAQAWFGDWKAPSPAVPIPVLDPQGPLPKGVRVVYPDEGFYDGVAMAEILWRGPDSMRQTKDTYTSDVFLYLLTSPVGKFKQNLMDKCPGLYDPEYISFNYPTYRDGGGYYFSTYLLLEDPAKDGPTLDRVAQIEKAVQDELALIVKDPEAYFGKDELAKAKAKLIDQNLLSMEVATDYVTGTLTFWWAAVSTDYFFGYEANCNKVGFAEIKDLLSRYLIGATDAIGLRMKEDAFLSEPGMAEKAKSLGYTEVTADNAFWWQK